MPARDAMSELLGPPRNTYDTWRLKDLTEEKSDQAYGELDEHMRALQGIKARITKGDLAGAAEGLKEIQMRLGQTAAGLAPQLEERGELDTQLIKLSKLASAHRLYEADNWIGRQLAKRAKK